MTTKQGVAAAMAAGAAFGVWLWVRRRREGLRFELGLKLSFGETRLVDVKVPVSTLQDESLKAEADDEGFVLCDVTLAKGEVNRVELASSSSEEKQQQLGGLFSTALSSAKCSGAILLPCFADAHTHTIKANAVPRTRNPTGSMTGAFLAEVDDLTAWWARDGDIKRRMRFALDCAFHHGTKFLRTHLDGSVSNIPEVRAQVWKAFDELRDEYAAKGLVVQGVANMFIANWNDEAVAVAHADEAKRHKNAILGSYCGNVSSQSRETTIASLDALFAQALRTGLDVDLHIDETNDPQCCALWALVASLEKARARGYAGHVVLGHCTALGLREDAAEIVAALAKLSPGVYVIANPFSNLRLQDRRGSGPPFSIAIPQDAPRTPKWRGITLLQELRAAGVAVAAASDNVRDFWRPYGDYDLLAAFAEAVAVAHLDTAPTEGAWFDLVTAVPTQIITRQSGLIAPGAPADLVLFPNARRASELLSRPQTDRVVIRRGALQRSQLPEYRVLDDLIQRKTTRTNLPGKSTAGTDDTAANLLKFK